MDLTFEEVQDRGEDEGWGKDVTRRSGRQGRVRDFLHVVKLNKSRTSRVKPSSTDFLEFSYVGICYGS